MDINEVMKLLPHRYPFLMVDRILEIVPGEKALGLKNVTIAEPVFNGHFPNQPILPGVLMLEAIAQVGACALLADDKYKHKLALLAGFDKVRFKRQVIPGDRLIISAELITMKGNIGKGKGSVTVDGEFVCGGEYMFALAEQI